MNTPQRPPEPSIGGFYAGDVVDYQRGQHIVVDGTFNGELGIVPIYNPDANAVYVPAVQCTFLFSLRK